jgi:hypothetical protein
MDTHFLFACPISEKKPKFFFHSLFFEKQKKSQKKTYMMQNIPNEVFKNVLFPFLCLQETANLCQAQTSLYKLYRTKLFAKQNFVLAGLLKHVNRCEERKDAIVRFSQHGGCECNNDGNHLVCRCDKPVRYIPRFLFANEREAFFKNARSMGAYVCRCHLPQSGIVWLPELDIQVLKSIPHDLSEKNQYLMLLETIKFRLLRVANALDARYVREVSYWISFIGLEDHFPTPLVREIRYPHRSSRNKRKTQT